jgi:hypothetical protein
VDGSTDGRSPHCSDARLSEPWRPVKWWGLVVSGCAWWGPGALRGLPGLIWGRDLLVGDAMVDRSFRVERFRPLGLSRAATLAWETRALRELVALLVEPLQVEQPPRGLPLPCAAGRPVLARSRPGRVPAPRRGRSAAAARGARPWRRALCGRLYRSSTCSRRARLRCQREARDRAARSCPATSGGRPEPRGRRATRPGPLGRRRGDARAGNPCAIASVAGGWRRLRGASRPQRKGAFSLVTSKTCQVLSWRLGFWPSHSSSAAFASRRAGQSVTPLKSAPRLTR